jgi:hypothetical protein
LAAPHRLGRRIDTKAQMLSRVMKETWRENDNFSMPKPWHPYKEKKVNFLAEQRILNLFIASLLSSS